VNSSKSSGHGGISIGGARSAAPRGIIFLLTNGFDDVIGGEILSSRGLDGAGIEPLRKAA